MHVWQLILRWQLDKQTQNIPDSFQWLHKPKKANIFMGRIIRYFLYGYHRDIALYDEYVGTVVRQLK